VKGRTPCRRKHQGTSRDPSRARTASANSRTPLIKDAGKTDQADRDRVHGDGGGIGLKDK
jgi:hypothetical protein